ncbi:MAG: cytochrome c oxidase subunit 3 [Roseivirga sp.]
MGTLTKEDKKKVQKPLLWIGLASIVMTFAGLTSGYFVSRSALMADNRWLQFPLPDSFLYATIAIVMSSVAIILAKRSAVAGAKGMTVNYLLITLLLGIAFTIFQFMGWNDLIERGIYFTGAGSSNSASWVYVLTILHWLHLFSGLIVLLYTIYRTSIGAYTRADSQGLTVSATYWHFLDILWVYLYVFLLIIR